MADLPSTRIVQAPSAGSGEEMTASGVSPGASYELPAYDSPQANPSPAFPDPGGPAKKRAPRSGARPPTGRKRYAPDDRLARPDVGRFGEEVVNGERRLCMGAAAEHADPQNRLNVLVGVCLAKGYVASTELLTRVEKGSDFATDVCVRRSGVDPATGGRYLEEISFEVANTQTREDLENERVPKLLACGVRRIIAILIPEGDVLEWSVKAGEWKGLAPGDEIRDPVFVQPLEVTAILDAAAVDQLVSKAQFAKKEPYLMGEIKKIGDKERAKGRVKGRTEGLAEGEAKGLVKGRTEGLAEGRTEGLAEGEAKGLAKSILRAFKKHGITLNAENREAILECQDMAILERWLDKAFEARSASEVLAELEKMN
jgi:hypothetical protein